MSEPNPRLQLLLLLDLLFPKTCLICGSFDQWLCVACARSVRLTQTLRCAVCEQPALNGVTHPACRSHGTLDGLLAAGSFEQLQQLLHAYKYLLVKELSGPLADVLVRYIKQAGLQSFLADMIAVPVPLHPRRLRYRGFNQSVLLAEAFCRQLSLPLAAAVLTRKRWTTPQVQLNKTQRRENMRETFDVTSAADAEGKKFLLVDDIATTSATLNACAKVLKQAGARTVWGLVLAHG